MQTVTNRLLVTGGSEAQPLTSDTIAQMAPDRVSRQMRAGAYVTTVVDEDVQIGGDVPTRLLLSESEELVASDAHHITLHAGAVSGVTRSGEAIDGLMLSGRKVREEYPSHWLNSPQWLRFRAEAMGRGEVVFEGVRRLRVRCGSTAVNNDRPIFFQRRAFGGGAFFAREAFVEAQLADDYLLLDDGVPVEIYTAEFYKRRPFIGVRPDRIRPGEVFDLTITVCDPESFDNLLIPRDDGLRTPDVRVKVNDVDITPALAEKFASFNPFGFPSDATSPYPGFRLVWPQMRIDEEMPLKIEVEVHDGLGNVNEVVAPFSVTGRVGPLGVDFFSFPVGVYHVRSLKHPETDLQRIYDAVGVLGFNIIHGNFYWANWDAINDWLTKTNIYRPFLKTLLEWLHIGEAGCAWCDWEKHIHDCLLHIAAEDNLRKVDMFYFPDEPHPVDPLDCKIPDDESDEPERCYPQRNNWDPWPLDFQEWRDGNQTYRQVFFSDFRLNGQQRGYRVGSICDYLSLNWFGSGKKPVYMTCLAPAGNDTEGSERRKGIWRMFMPYSDVFSVDRYPIKWRDPGTPAQLAEIAMVMDEMKLVRSNLFRLSPRKPRLFLVLESYLADPDGAEPNPRCPTREEYVAMTYLAITHGVEGLMYFDYEGIQMCLHLREAAIATNRELQYLAPIINSPDARKRVTISEVSVPLSGTGGPPRPESPTGHGDVGQSLSIDARDTIGTRESLVEGYPAVHSLPLKAYGGYYYLVTVNGLNRAVRAHFECWWFPGFEKHEGAMEYGIPPVEVLFEKGLDGTNRKIFLLVEQCMVYPWPPRKVDFYDDYEPYERHVYKIPRAATPPWVLPLEDLDRIISEALSIPGHL